MMLSAILPIAALLCGASFVSAKSISPDCEKALENVLKSPDAACLNPAGLIPVFTSGNASVVAPIDKWLTGLCSVAPCTNQTLAAIVANITSGCPRELNALGLGSTSAEELTVIVQTVYPTVRKTFCLKNTGTGQLCVTETLTGIEKITGPLTIDMVIAGLINPEVYLSKIPKEVICSNCEKAAYNIVNQDFPLPPPYKAAVAATCGDSFVDGQNPPGISQSAASRRRR